MTLIGYAALYLAIGLGFSEFLLRDARRTGDQKFTKGVYLTGALLWPLIILVTATAFFLRRFTFR